MTEARVGNRTRYPGGPSGYHPMQPSPRDRPRLEPERRLAAVIAVQQEVAMADLDLANVMALITRRAMELTAASGAVVEMREGDEMVYRSVAGFAEPFVGLRLSARASISGLCVEQRVALRSDDTETDDRVDRAACRRVGVRSMIVVPLMLRDRTVGVLKVMSAEPAWFVDEDTSTLQLMAGLIAAALAHAAAFEAKTRAEQRRTAELEALLANAPLGIAFFDREHRYVRINRMLAELNLKSPEEHLGRTIVEVLGAYGRPFDEKVAEVFETARGVEWEVSARLGAAIRARDEFVSVASHELKTPLTSLQLQVEGLRRALARGRDATTDERVRKFSEQTSRQTARLGQLVDDMLDLSRIATGKFAIDPGPMDLATTVQEVVDRLRPQLEAANGEVRLRLEPAPGQWDRQRLEQVVSNLLTNAMRYGKGAPVTVELRRLPDAVLLTVRDQGIGIASRDLGRIFERFERAISASEVSGLGLGLFISRQIVDAHHGRIWAESELGKGAAFHVRLPLKA